MRAAAHVIVGARDEPFLGAMLQSLEGAVGAVLVNDNAPDPSPHAAALAASSFAHAGRLFVDRTPFAGFAQARNVCLRLHEKHDAGEWALNVDTDEVHADILHSITSQLGAVPSRYDHLDGYMRHFFMSFDWYTSIERRKMLFRFRPGLHWEGAVHERLVGLDGARLALPYVYATYGSALGVRRFAEKGRLYSSLGQEGAIVAEAELDTFDARAFFADYYPRLLRFRGEHPRAARATVGALRPALSADHGLTDRMARAQPPWIRLRNAVARINYEQRWRSRRLHPVARELVERRASTPRYAPT
ncbi:MAG TPA: hypothetical protein VN603_12795 [Candidatus Acidoferrales bacterium]|nr:hypothetical protein [Candidatus Acidoferrales bacterium]